MRSVFILMLIAAIVLLPLVGGIGLVKSDYLETRKLNAKAKTLVLLEIAIIIALIFE